MISGAWVDGKPAMNFPVCTGKSAHETPRGKFSIIQKDADYRSRSYGSVFDASGLCVNSDATSSSRVPPGGKFIGAKMPLWMRIHGGVRLQGGHAAAAARESLPTPMGASGFR